MIYKLNRKKVATLYSYKGFEFGYYNSGRAFVALDGDIVDPHWAAVHCGLGTLVCFGQTNIEIVRLMAQKLCS